MDAAPRSFTELPVDEELGVPIPFACGTSGFGQPRDGGPSVRRLDHRRVTQCALSRVCGVCGAGLGRPLAFLGSAEEAARNAFHFPAAHLECVEALATALAGVDAAVLGQPEPLDGWVVLTTPAFEYVRPSKEDVDPRPTFQPHSVLSQWEAGQSSLVPGATSPGRGPV